MGVQDVRRDDALTSEDEPLETLSCLQNPAINHPRLQLLRKLVVVINNATNLHTHYNPQLIADIRKQLGKDKEYRIIEFFMEKEATTQREVKVTLEMDKARVSNIFENLMDQRVIHVTGYVEKQFSGFRRGGPRPRIYALIDAPPEACQMAQVRYGEIIRRGLAQKPGEQVKEEKRRISQLVGEYVQKVAAIMPDNAKLGDVYPCLRKVGIPEELWPAVKDEIVGLLSAKR